MPLNIYIYLYNTFLQITIFSVNFSGRMVISLNENLQHSKLAAEGALKKSKMKRAVFPVYM